MIDCFNPLLAEERGAGGKIFNRYKMGKHFQLHIEDGSFPTNAKQPTSKV
jgi:hypothetical protein